MSVKFVFTEFEIHIYAVFVSLSHAAAGINVQCKINFRKYKLSNLFIKPPDYVLANTDGIIQNLLS